MFEYQSNQGLEINFSNIYVQSSRGLRFHSANLQRCKVVGTNLDACYFNDVRWPKVRSHASILDLRIYNWAQSYGWKVWCDYTGLFPSLFYILWNFPGYMLRGVKNFIVVVSTRTRIKEPLTESLERKIYGVCDHNSFISQREVLDWEKWQNQCAQLSKAYRDLKVAYEQDKDYIYASDFHFNEKELRRINPDVPWPTKFQLNLFWLINGYGERALRPVGWFLLFLVIGTLVYKFGGGITHSQPMAFSVSDVHVIAKMPGNTPQGMPNADSILFPVVPWRSPFFVIWESARSEVKTEVGVSGGSSGGAGIRWREAAGFSAATMAFLRPDFLMLQEGFSFTRAMSWFQTIVGPALFGMFALAIRNKLKR